MSLCLHFLRVSTGKKESFAGGVHKNVFNGCNVPENGCNGKYIWRAEMWLQSFSVSVLDKTEWLTPHTEFFFPPLSLFLSPPPPPPPLGGENLWQTAFEM